MSKGSSRHRGPAKRAGHLPVSAYDVARRLSRRMIEWDVWADPQMVDVQNHLRDELCRLTPDDLRGVCSQMLVVIRQYASELPIERRAMVLDDLDQLAGSG